MLVGQLFSALTSLLLLAKGDADAVRGVRFWLLGARGTTRWDILLIIAAVLIPAFLVLWELARYLDTISFGDATANTMGAPVSWGRVIALMTGARLTAATVPVVGAIGFVGLIVPPTARLVPANALLSAVRQLSFSEQVGLERTSMQVREIVEMDRLTGQGCLFSQPEGQDRRLLEQAMADADMTGVTQRRYPTLSDGEKQRTHVARALA